MATWTLFKISFFIVIFIIIIIIIFMSASDKITDKVISNTGKMARNSCLKGKFLIIICNRLSSKSDE